MRLHPGLRGLICGMGRMGKGGKGWERMGKDGKMGRMGVEVGREASVG